MLKSLLLVFALAGLGVSGWLAFSHYRIFTDITYHSFCAISQALNCDTVSQSPYALLLSVPVAVWALVGYSFLGMLVLMSKRQPSQGHLSGPALLLTSFGFVIYSLILAYISSVQIKSYCLMCIALYGINFALLLLSWSFVRPRRYLGLVVLLRQDVKTLLQGWNGRLLLGSFGVLAAGLIAFFPAYWHYEFPPLENNLPQGITADGHPYLGAPHPVLEIVEFADYQCFQCKKMHYLLRRLIAAYPNQIRLVHRHFPMDHQFNPLLQEPFYVGSGVMALMALYAADHGRFWPMNDALYHADRSRGRLDIGALLEQAGISNANPSDIYAQVYREQLWKDLRAGLELGITGTPTYLIDGQVYVANIPGEVLRRVVRGY